MSPAMAIRYHRSLQLLSLFLLVCCFSSFPFVSCTDATDGLYPISIGVTSAAVTWMRQATSAYAVETKFNASVTPTASTAVALPAYLSGQFDFSIAVAALSSSQLQITPQHRNFPLIGNAIVPIYNLPTLGTVQLILPIQAICDIERGNLTNWNDERIQSANPTIVMPNLGITVFHLTISALGNDGVTGICGKIDPIFASQIPRSANPTWPSSKYFATGSGSSSDILSSMVVDTPGGYAMCTLQNVLAMKAKVAAIKNSAGVVLTPTINSISLNLLEMAIGPIPTGATTHDLAGPISPNAWPICTLTYIWLDTKNPVTTCATKASVLKFILWLFSSSSVKLLAQALNMAIVPDLFITQTDLLSDLTSSIMCQGSKLVSTTQDRGIVEGFNAGSTLLGAYFNYFKAVQTTHTFEFKVNTERLATQRLVASEVDLALVNTHQLADSDVDLLVRQVSGRYIPAFFSGVAVTFTLPTVISSKWSTWTATSGLPALYPLILDIETVAGIFAGDITSWLDERILATSPQLLSWFTTYPTAKKEFDILVCCSLSTEQPVAGMLLMQNLNSTQVARSKNFTNFFQTPLTWSEQLRVHPSLFQILDLEARMAPKSANIQIAKGGTTIGYKLINGATSDITSEFQIVQTVNGIKEILKPEPSNFQTCAIAAGFTPGLSSTPTSIELAKATVNSFYTPPTAPISACYPLSSPLSFGLDMVYFGTDCTRGNHSLTFLNWLARTDSLSTAALNAGSFRVADLPDMQLKMLNLINSATCDGETLLITLPKVWEVAPAVQALGLAATIIDSFVFIVCGILLVVFRHRSVFRSSSVPFLGVTLVGLFMMMVAVAAWTQPVGDDTCGPFMWFASLGFSLVFVPFFAKTYRIWAIFSRQKLKVVKMSNKKLMIGVGALIAAEIALLLVWSQVDPLQPIEYLRNVNGRMHQATHCGVKGHGMTFVVIEAVYKGLLLVAGTMLAFSTRNVSSAFNESSAIAWSIYNVLFSSVIVGAIVYFVDAFEDALILLFLFLIGWIVIATWGLLFGAKFYAFFSHSEADAAIASKISSLQTEKSNGFSFVSVVSMPVAMLKSYILALDGQLVKAKKQLTIALGQAGNALAGGGIGAKQRTIRSAKGTPELPGQTSGLNETCEEANGDELDRDYPHTQQQTNQLHHRNTAGREFVLPPGVEHIESAGVTGGGAGVPDRGASGVGSVRSPSMTSVTSPGQSPPSVYRNTGLRGTNGGRVSPSMEYQKRLVLNAYNSNTQLATSPSRQDAQVRRLRTLSDGDSNSPVIAIDPSIAPPAVDRPLFVPTYPSGSATSIGPGLDAIDESTGVSPSESNRSINSNNNDSNSPVYLSSAPRPSSRATHQITAAALKE